MKKMNYEAPKAEMIEMQMSVVLTVSVPGGTGNSGSGFPTPSGDPSIP